jgi:hypothetical protein
MVWLISCLGEHVYASGAVSSPARRDHDQAISCQFPVDVVNRPGGYAVVVSKLAHRGKLLAVLPLVGVEPVSQIVKDPDARTFSRSAHGPMIIAWAGMILCLPWLLRIHVL